MLLLISPMQDTLEDRHENGQFTLDHVPDNLGIHLIVAMNDVIPHTANLRPRYVTICCLNLTRDQTCSFADVTRFHTTAFSVLPSAQKS